MSSLLGTCLLIPPTIEEKQPSVLKESYESRRPKRRKLDTKAITKKQHWVGCLFTSYGYGKPTRVNAGKDSPEKILSNTRAALKELREQAGRLDAMRLDLAEECWAGRQSDTSKITSTNGAAGRESATGIDSSGKNAKPNANLGPLYACKFNSGSFDVKWKDTRALIEEVFEGSSKAMYVVSPPFKT